MMDWKQRKILVLGARSRGLATARYLLDSGAEVYLSDPGIQPEEVSGLSQLKEVAKAQWLPWGKPIETSVEIIFRSLGSRGPWMLADGARGGGGCDGGTRVRLSGESMSQHCHRRIQWQIQRGSLLKASRNPGSEKPWSLPRGCTDCWSDYSNKTVGFLTLKLSPEQLQQTTFFGLRSPCFSILPRTRHGGDSLDDVCRQMARLFANQQAHDWLIIK